MMMPSVFGESLFDDLMDFPFEKEFFGHRNPLYGKHAQNVMKTDIKETDGAYEMDIDLPGFKKEDVNAKLENGYLTITAAKGLDKDEKNKEGVYIRRERYTGQCARTFYVGDAVTQEDIKAKFEDGILKVGAYAFDTLGISLSNGFTVSGICLGVGTPIKTNGDKDTTNTGLYANASGHYEFSVHSASAAQHTIESIDKMINVVDSKRAELGALQNRMESTIRNQENVSENVSDARSRIRDADYAEEAANLSAQNIVQQAATTVLTQANSRPQIAMSLLNGG